MHSVAEERTFEQSGHFDPSNVASFITPASNNTSAGTRRVKAVQRGTGTLGGVAAYDNRIPPDNMAIVHASPTH